MKKKDLAAHHMMKISELVRAANAVSVKVKEYEMNKITGKVKNTREIKVLKDNLAVILTIKREKEIVHED